MNKKINYQEIIQDQMTVSKKLLTTYYELGLNETELILLIQITRFADEGNHFPTPFELAQSGSFSEEEAARMLRKLVQKGFLSIEKNDSEQTPISESYSLEPLMEKLYEEDAAVVNRDEENIGNIFILFEQEFGRPLSPFEIETINSWLDEDGIEPSLIKAGLRESVLMSKLNFKYIDRILREWKKKGIHTVQDARKASQQFHQGKSDNNHQTNTRPKRDTSFYYNWLEGD
ncbi:MULTISPECIES: DnaD domain-containing protein [Oceanobacillus]|uniref:DnaD domain protein n=1 Tax=Oceanobacillus aidingensis TaxID=645964 RepID=A0ABV9K227_9BACI|nr:DnaD domain-containing protein [Oceanobacillus oncorhynchi]MDM8101575.1 DnaD domain-containing protein [Oceanobacillus oncorhynchi]UUI38070.1 DnaD domain-containing protein [Oceanobacillus oncorhynchi]